MHAAVAPRRDDFAVGCDRHRIERARQGDDDRRLRRGRCERPDPHGFVIARADGPPVRQECDGVDVLRMAFEHAGRAPGERPDADGVIPRCRGKVSAVRRNRERHDRRGTSREHRIRLLAAQAPDRDAAVLARGRGAAVRQ